jgi:hypothetical protein
MWGSIIGTVAGGLLGSRSARKAADAQVAAANRAAEIQKQMFDKQVELNAPFRDAGLNAQNRLLNYMGLGTDTNTADFGKYARDFSMDDFQQDPGYNFRLSEGLKALDRQAAARGGLISGAALKAAQNYGQQSASQEYNNAFNRYQTNRSNQLNPLQSLMNAGQTSTNILSNSADNLGRGLADTYTQAGNARASGYIGRANALSSMLSSGINSFNSNNLLNSIR